MKDIRIIGVDLGKNSCSLVGLDATGRVVLRRRVRRDGLVALLGRLPDCTVRWRPAAVLTTLGGSWQRKGEKCG